jgi:acyl-CoA thioesterase FadM
MATAKATLVCIALDERKAVPVPAEFRERVASFEGVLA